MELPKFNRSDNSMFDNIKSKLGIGSDAGSSYEGSRRGRASRNEYYDTASDNYDDYDDYDDYDEYDNAYGDNSYNNAYDSTYDNHNDYDNNGGYDMYATSGSERLSARSSARGSGQRLRRASATAFEPSYSPDAFGHTSHAGVTRPRLVTAEDVRAHTSLDVSIPSSGFAGTDAGNTRVARVGAAAPASTGTQTSANARATGTTAATPSNAGSGIGAFDFSSSASELRSEGLNSLFTPSHSHSSARELVVVKPTAYDDVSRMAHTVRAGNVFVLCLASTSPELARRLSDFSFGVASALDARIDCVANKVFAICVGNALSPQEMNDLKKQGAL